MVVLSQAALDHFPAIKACKPARTSAEIPAVDLMDPEAAALLVKAGEEFGFFKAVNHGVPLELMDGLEEEALKFFNLPQVEKDGAGPPDPFGYGSKRIGPHGDVGWVEYLLLTTNPDIDSPNSLSTFLANRQAFR